MMKHKWKNQTCKTCTYYHTADKKEDLTFGGNCRRFPSYIKVFPDRLACAEWDVQEDESDA